MNSPTGRREALEVLTRRGLSQRKVCRYLGLRRQVSAYVLKQSEKDRSLEPEKDLSLGERLTALPGSAPVRASPDLGLVVAGRVVRAGYGVGSS